MPISTTALALVILALIPGVYVAANIIVIALIQRHFPRLWRSAARAMRQQLAAISRRRIWGTVAAYLVAFAVLIKALNTPLSVTALGTALLAYVFLVSALSLSLLRCLPLIQRLWAGTFFRLATLTLPVYLGFVAKGYAGMWVGELTGIGASNLGFALFAGTAFVLCLAVATALFGLALLFEFCILITAVATGPKDLKSKAFGLLCLSIFSFVSNDAAGNAALQLSGSRIGNAVLTAIVFDFDAGPAEHCALTPAERREAQRDEPFIKAIFLSTSPEKALLVRRSPALFRPIVLHNFSAESSKERRLESIRIVECFTSTPAPAAGATQSPAR